MKIMKTQKSRFFLTLLTLLSLISPLLAQKKQIIFAVLNDGRALEPIVQVEGGKIVELESNAENGWKDFAKIYYKPKTTYNLIFGGIANGKVTVVKSAPESDCAANMAEATTVSAKAKLKGLLMGLASDVPIKKGTVGMRRLPTLAERTELEKIIRAEFTKQKVSASNLKGLRFHNLTALDTNNDKKPEFVGSYWLPTSKTERAMLFFIAEKDANGKYVFMHSEFSSIKQADVMSANIKDVDNGILHELLLDAFDVDGDGTAEIFTIGQAFEGNNFRIYKRDADKWTKSTEVYNYHCGY